jgi:hypothetical protein
MLGSLSKMTAHTLYRPPRSQQTKKGRTLVVGPSGEDYR